MSLRWKIAISLALIGVAMTALVGFFTVQSTSDRLLDEVDQSIDQAGQLLSSRGDRFPQRRGAFDVYSIRRLDAAGRVTVSTFESAVPIEADVVERVSGSPLGRSRDTVVADDGERIRLHTVGLANGAVQIGRSLAETDAVTDDLRRRTFAMTALAALLSAVAGWIIAGRVAAPLRRLASSADEVRETGRLDVGRLAVGGSSRDEVGQLARAFSSMLDALGRSRADQERLVQDAGHELRTPLTSLRTNLAVMRRHRDMPDDMREEIVADLEGEVTELTDLVNELVTVASGELHEQPAERIDVGDATAAVSERVGRRYGRDVNLQLTAHAFVSIPRAGLDRSISNLVENACKFDTTGSPIDVVVAASPTMVSVRVSDRGPGIPETELDRVFDRFHRSEATQSMPGSGLGLAMLRDIVLAHGGSVSASNRDGGGAEVGFDLPRVD